MLPEIKEIESKIKTEIASCTTLEELAQVKVKYLGKKGIVTGLLKKISTLPLAERKKVGQLLNKLKQQITTLLKSDEERLLKIRNLKKIEAETIDVTLPGQKPLTGHLHPLTLIFEEIENIFSFLGFSIKEGPEIEEDWYNFEALNIPPDHPARDMQDTFYISEKVVLRTHTSPVQIRVMEKEKPPLRIIVPGKVYRCDADVSHSPMFHQVEGLLVDEKVTVGHLKGILTLFFQQLFGDEIKLRFRPSYFPFTEPSLEVDISCIFCPGTGCRLCGNTGWLEVAGAGLVHPNVFRAVGYDPERYTGFAFGLGVDRLAMLKYGIDDIRLFFENDLRFLRQFV